MEVDKTDWRGREWGKNEERQKICVVYRSQNWWLNGVIKSPLHLRNQAAIQPETFGERVVKENDYFKMTFNVWHERGVAPKN